MAGDRQSARRALLPGPRGARQTSVTSQTNFGMRGSLISNRFPTAMPGPSSATSRVTEAVHSGHRSTSLKTSQTTMEGASISMPHSVIMYQMVHEWRLRGTLGHAQTTKVHTHNCGGNNVERSAGHSSSPEDSRKGASLGNDAEYLRAVHRQGRRVGRGAGNRVGDRQQPGHRARPGRSVGRLGPRGARTRRATARPVRRATASADTRPTATARTKAPARGGRRRLRSRASADGRHRYRGPDRHCQASQMTEDIHRRRREATAMNHRSSRRRRGTLRRTS